MAYDPRKDLPFVEEIQRKEDEAKHDATIRRLGELTRFESPDDRANLGKMLGLGKGDLDDMSDDALIKATANARRHLMVQRSNQRADEAALRAAKDDMVPTDSLLLSTKPQDMIAKGPEITEAGAIADAVAIDPKFLESPEGQARAANATKAIEQLLGNYGGIVFDLMKKPETAGKGMQTVADLKFAVEQADKTLRAGPPAFDPQTLEPLPTRRLFDPQTGEKFAGFYADLFQKTIMDKVPDYLSKLAVNGPPQAFEQMGGGTTLGGGNPFGGQGAESPLPITGQQGGVGHDEQGNLIMAIPGPNGEVLRKQAIRVQRLADGTTGSLPVDEFDPNVYKLLEGSLPSQPGASGGLPPGAESVAGSWDVARGPGPEQFQNQTAAQAGPQAFGPRGEGPVPPMDPNAGRNQMGGPTITDRIMGGVGQAASAVGNILEPAATSLGALNIVGNSRSPIPPTANQPIFTPEVPLNPYSVQNPIPNVPAVDPEELYSALALQARMKKEALMRSRFARPVAPRPGVAGPYARPLNRTLGF